MIKLLNANFLVSGALLLLAGCNAAAPVATNTASPAASAPLASPKAIPTPSVTPSVESPASSLRTPQPPVISAQGIGSARLGMTYGELKQQVERGTTFEVKSPFIVDFDAIAVSRSGKTLYYILYLADTTFSDTDVIQGLLTDNDSFRTAEQVGPGTSIRQAENAYGKVTLSYNTQNESREFARFQKQPAPNISFGTGNGSGTTAGIYASPTAEFNETQQYREDATIESVLVVCLTESCAQ